MNKPPPAIHLLLAIITNACIDIWSDPTFLPPSLAADYDKPWTKERMLKVTEAVKKNNVGIEVDNQQKLPFMDFLKLAKEQGCLFTSGGIYINNKLNSPDYFVEVMQQCELGHKDIYIPDNN